MAQVVLDRNTVVHAVQIACLAPSIHNSQPWRWVLDSDLKLFLDVSRVLGTDTARREALLSCGAVLDHFHVAAAAAGWRTTPEYFPNPNDSTHLATIDFARMPYVTDAHRDRVQALERRHTDRLPFRPPTNWPVVARVIERVVPEPVFLDVLPESARPRVVEASQLSAGLRRYDTAYHEQIEWWTAPFKLSDGIPRTALLSEDERGRTDIGRDFPVDRHLARRTEVPEDRALLAVLSTDEDSPRHFLHAGEALSAVLLEATVVGLETGTLTHITELPETRQILREITDRECPQVMIRIGTVPSLEAPSPPTPRRPLSDVLQFGPG